MLYEEAMSALRKGERVAPRFKSYIKYLFMQCIEDENFIFYVDKTEAKGKLSDLSLQFDEIDFEKWFFHEWDILEKPKKLITFKEMIDPLRELKMFSRENFKSGQYIQRLIGSSEIYFYCKNKPSAMVYTFDLYDMYSNWYLVE